MSNLDKANIILEQLGGKKFIAMTGANHFAGTNDSLTFRLPSRFAQNGINLVKIRIKDNDLYNVEFLKRWAKNIKVIANHDDLYADMLKKIFTSETGLDTHL